MPSLNLKSDEIWELLPWSPALLSNDTISSEDEVYPDVPSYTGIQKLKTPPRLDGIFRYSGQHHAEHTVPYTSLIRAGNYLEGSSPTFSLLNKGFCITLHALNIYPVSASRPDLNLSEVNMKTAL